MEYEVILSGQAKEGFRKIVSYLCTNSEMNRRRLTS